MQCGTGRPMMLPDLVKLGFTMLVYPGLLFVALVVTATGRVLAGSTRGRALRGFWRAGRGVGNAAYVLAVLSVLLALVCLPWPAAPWQLRWSTTIWWIWALMEISVVATLLPMLIAPAPEVSRAAVREAQLGVSGRLPIWIAMVAMIGAADTELSAAWVVALLAVVLVLPAAAGWAPFGPRSSDLEAHLASSGCLTDEELALAVWIRRLHGIFWLALVGTVFVPLPGLAWWIELQLRLVVILGLALIARGSRGLLLRRSLPAALRWCWWVGLPCAIVAVVLLAK